LEGLVETDAEGKEHLRTDVNYTEFILERTKPVTESREK